MALALPGAVSAPTSAPSTPKKDKSKKRVRPKKKDDKEDSDVELEVSAEDLVGADGDGDGDGEGEGDVDADDADGDADGDGDGEGEDGEGDGTKRAKGKRRARDEDEEEEGVPDVVSDMGNIKREAKRRRDQMFLFRGALDDEQAKRFDAFRSAVIPKAAIKKINKDLYDQNIPTNVTSVVAGMVKVFVADVVEIAREIQQHTEDPTGPLRPYHLQLARMRLQEQGVLGAPAGMGTPQSSTGLRARRPLFRR